MFTVKELIADLKNFASIYGDSARVTVRFVNEDGEVIVSSDLNDFAYKGAGEYVILQGVKKILS